MVRTALSARIVTSQVTLWSIFLSVAVIVALPAALPVTLPVAETVATSGSVLTHSRGSPEPPVVLRIVASPTFISRVFFAIAKGGVLTVTSQLSFSPESVEAVMVTFPGATAVTFPLASTFAMEGSELSQVRLLSLGSVTVIVFSSPGNRSMDVGLMEKELVTVTFAVAVSPLESAAVMVHSPGASALTIPLSLTDATLSSDVAQVMVLSFRVSGVTVGVRVSSSPTRRLFSVMSSVMKPTLGS